MGYKWTDANSMASRDGVAGGLLELARSIADGREITVDERMANEVRRRDTQMWAQLKAQGRTS